MLPAPAAVARRLSRAAADQVAARTAEQVFATLGELKGGAAKLGQTMAVFEAAMPEEVAAPYRAALRRLTDAAPAMPPEVARRVVAADLAVAYGPGWQDRAGASSTHATQLTWPPGCSGTPSTPPRRAPAGCTLTCTPATSYCSRAAVSACWTSARSPPRPAASPRHLGSSPPQCSPGDGPAAIRLARQAGALAPDAEVDPRLIIELLHPLAATGAAASFTYSRVWLRGLMAHFTEPRFAPALRNLTPPPQYALLWRATLSAAGLFAQLGATVPTRGFHLAYSPGFRGSIP